MLKLIAAAALAIGTAMPAAATVLDFDAARGNRGDTGYVYGAWQEDGFSVSTDRCSPTTRGNLCLVTSGSALKSLDRTGAALVNYLGGSAVTVARMDGAAFLFDAIDMASNYGNQTGLSQPTLTVDFNFNFFDGTSRAATYTLANTRGQALTVNTLTFDLAPLSSFSFTPKTNSSGFVQFDNITLSAVASAVPEPSTWAMMIVGFGMVGGTLRRRKTNLAVQAA